MVVVAAPVFSRCRFGEIESIRVLHERFCAFINFRNANMAARALERLQVSDGQPDPPRLARRAAV